MKLDESTNIKELDQEETNKYLGKNKGDGVQYAKMEEKIRIKCYKQSCPVNRIKCIKQTRSNQHDDNTSSHTQLQYH